MDIPNSVTLIEGSFEFCQNLSTVSIGKNVKEISSNAFAMCKNIQQVKFTSIEHACSIKYSNQCNPAENSDYAVSLYINDEQVRDLVIPDGVRSIGDYSFCNFNLSSVTISNNATSIGSYAFKNSTMMKVDIPNGVKTIGFAAFQGCDKLTSVTIPESVISIESNAFKRCSCLTSVVIPDNIASIGSSAFDETPWFNHLPDGVIYIGKVVYTYKGDMPKNTKIVLNEGAERVSDYAFYECKGLTSVLIPNSVTSIGGSAFRDCSNLATVICMSKKGVEFGMYAFFGIDSTAVLSLPPFCEEVYDDDWYDYFKHVITDIKVDGLYYNIDDDDDGTAWLEDPILDRKPYSGDIVIPSSVTYEGVVYPVVGIDNGAFENATIKSVVIPDGVRNIDDRSFYNCEELTSITIPKTVRSIGESAFMYCDEVETLVCLVKNPFPIKGKGEEGAVFSNYFFNNVPLYVPKGTADTYRETEGWKDFANIVDGIPTGIEKVGYSDSKVMDYYDMSGRRMSKAHHGIGIIHGSDGTIRKNIIK